MKIWATIAMVVYIGACGIATSLPLSTVERLDTSNIIGFRFADSTLIQYTMEKIKSALPLETSLCYTGFIEDTTYYTRTSRTSEDTIEITRQLVTINGAYEANIKEAGIGYVNYQDDGACDPKPDLIATAHSHPGGTPFDHCDHSDTDAIFNHNRQTKYVMSFVWCQWGLGILWADGRRWERNMISSVLTNFR